MAISARTDLKKVLAYKNREVVLRYAEDFAVSRRDAEEIFLETKRWLWLCNEHSRLNLGRLTMNEEMSALDQMWHTFLLFTEDYAEFCERFLGQFVHHVPMTSKQKSKTTKQRRLTQLRANYEFIYDHLGPEVLERWCTNCSLS